MLQFPFGQRLYWLWCDVLLFLDLFTQLFIFLCLAFSFADFCLDLIGLFDVVFFGDFDSVIFFVVVMMLAFFMVLLQRFFTEWFQHLILICFLSLIIRITLLTRACFRLSHWSDIIGLFAGVGGRIFTKS